MFVWIVSHQEYQQPTCLDGVFSSFTLAQNVVKSLTRVSSNNDVPLPGTPVTVFDTLVHSDENGEKLAVTPQNEHGTRYLIVRAEVDAGKTIFI